MYLNIDGKEIKIIYAKSFIKKLKGLMDKKNIDYGMLFKKTNSIHTFFMKDSIDVIGLDNQNVVIFKAINVQKNKILTINNKIKNTSVLELPKNTSKSIKIGDILTFESK